MNGVGRGHQSAVTTSAALRRSRERREQQPAAHEKCVGMFHFNFMLPSPTDLPSSAEMSFNYKSSRREKTTGSRLPSSWNTADRLRISKQRTRILPSGTRSIISSPV